MKRLTDATMIRVVVAGVNQHRSLSVIDSRIRKNMIMTMTHALRRLKTIATSSWSSWRQNSEAVKKIKMRTVLRAKDVQRPIEETMCEPPTIIKKTLPGPKSPAISIMIR